MKKDKIFSMRLPSEWVETLKSIAREKSYNENKDISYIDLIEVAIKKEYIKEITNGNK